MIAVVIPGFNQTAHSEVSEGKQSILGYSEMISDNVIVNLVSSVSSLMSDATFVPKPCVTAPTPASAPVASSSTSAVAPQPSTSAPGVQVVTGVLPFGCCR